MSVGTFGGDEAVLRVRDNAQLTVDGDFNLSDNGGSKGTLYLDGGLAQGGTVYIGKGANTSGTVVQTGGQLVANGDLYLANDGASTGNYTLSAGDIIVNGGVMRVGYNGAGTLTQTGGSISTANWFVVGQAGNKTSTYDMSGGTLDVNTNGGGEMLQVGVSGTVDAHLNLSGNAAVTVHSSATNIGSDQATATGTVTVADSATFTTPILRVGNTGIGHVIQSGGTVTVTNGGDTTMIGANAGAHGSYQITGGTLNVSSIQTGAYGTGELVAGGNAQLNVGGWFDAARWPTGVGTITLRDSAVATAIVNSTIIGEQGLGTLNVQGNALLDTNGLWVGLSAGSTGIVNQSGGTINIRAGGTYEVGRAGTGTVNQTGGAVTGGDILYVRPGGAYNQSGGTVTTNRTLLQGAAAAPGELILSGSAVYNNASYLSVGTLAGDVSVLRVQDYAQLIVGSDFNVSDNPGSTGTFHLEGGVARGNYLLVGKNAGNVGSMVQTGGLMVVNANPQIGGSGQGSLDQTGGLFYHVNHMAVGRYSGGLGTYDLGGAGVNAGRWMILAEAGGATGQVNVSGGSTLSLGGSSVSPASLEVARDGNGTFTQTGGMVFADTARIASGSGGNGTYNLGGGVLETRALTMGPGTGAFHFTGGALRVGSAGFSLNNQGGTLDVCTPATAGWNVRWYDGNDMTDNPGSWVPPTPYATQIVDAIQYDGSAPPGGYPGGSSDYYGAVYTGYVYAPVAGNYSFRERVDDASLLKVDGSTVLWDYTAASDFGEPTGDPWTVHSSTTVALSQGWHALEFRWSDHWGGQNAYLEWDPAGGQSWSLLVGGAVFADLGGEIGTATINGDYTQSTGGTLLMDVDADQGVWDVLEVNGTLYAGGDLEVNIDGDLPPLGTTYDLLDFTAMVGTFDNVTINGPALPPAMFWNLENLYVTGEISLGVPEPATGMLAALGWLILGALGLMRRRRRR